MVESLLFIGAGAGEKNPRSRSKKDRLRNTGLYCRFHVLVVRVQVGQHPVCPAGVPAGGHFPRHTQSAGYQGGTRLDSGTWDLR